VAVQQVRKSHCVHTGLLSCAGKVRYMHVT